MSDFPYKSHWMDLSGVGYHFLDEGALDAPVVVMLHGNPSWSYYYRRLVAPLARHYRVIVPDHIGMGLSDKPGAYEYTLAQHIHNLETLLEAVAPRRMVLVLHDWGGMIGMGYAARHPERIQGLVVLNTTAFLLDALPFSIRLARSPLAGEFLVRGLNAFARGALQQGVVQQRRLTRAERAAYLQPYDSWENRIGIYRFVQDIPVEEDHPTRRTLAEVEAGLGQFGDTPVLIAWGMQDPVFTQAFLDGWKHRFPHARVHTYADAGHYVLEDAHERILPCLLDYLDEVWEH